MSSTNYTRWWRDGTIAVTKNSQEVTGTSTYWATANINPGDIFKINGVDYEVQSVTDDTHITLATAYTGETGSGLAYAIVRNFTSNTNAKVAAQTSELMYDFAHYIDKEHSTITGKSAYEVAKDNGYVGTEAEWLESLKAAGEWSNADSRLTTLESKTTTLEGYNAGTRLTTLESKTTTLETTLNTIPEYQKETVAWNPYITNCMPRFKNLGTSITAEHYASLNHLRVGDYWNLQCGKAIIVQNNAGFQNRLDIALITKVKAPMNDTNTTEGGYFASKLCNETMPTILAQLEAEIGADHIALHEHTTGDSNELDDYGISHTVYKENIKLDLFSEYQIMRFPEKNPPLAFFQILPERVYGNNGFISLSGFMWLQDVSRYYPDDRFVAWSPGYGMTNAEATASQCIVAHFRLIP